ncbi:hypothetical protein CVT24_011080 [Panaeolus cyanescens]|uniref:Uncharacterized protein n=1 Tax=Panaeolus cyanescens TaxID=181874 RepID=A0A409YYF9_9AGAR|nr:hypothetical protein CVT24_011080 [Panaeolus cyanescens]
MTGDYDYDAAMKQIKDLRARKMTTDERTKAFHAMSEKIQASSDDIKEQVKKLAEQTTKTKDAFEFIRRKLHLVDENHYKDKNGRPVAKFEPTWKRYQARYTDLLWRTRDAATDTEVYFRDLVEAVFDSILQNDSAYEDNVKDLTEFANRANKVAENSTEDDYKVLQADVAKFVEGFSHFAEDEGAKLSAEIAALTNEIKALQKELSDLNGLIEEMGIAMGVTLGAGAGGIVAALLVLGPTAGTAIIPILITGISAIIGETATLIKALTRKSTVESDIADKQQEIDKLTGEQKTLEELRAKLELCADESTDMFGRLANFSNMWSHCAADTRSLLSVIAEIHTDKSVEARIRLMKETYTSAADALRFYATYSEDSTSDST